MAPRGKALARRQLICESCSSWIQFDSSGCTNSSAEMTGAACVFTCKGCTEVTRLVGEVGGLRQMMESMKRMITQQGLEEERGVTGIQVARLEETEEKEKCERVMTPGNSSTEESRNGKETAERSSSEDRGTLIEIEGELMGRKRIGSCWMGREYIQEHRCLQRTDIRRTRMVQMETSWI